MTIDDMRAVLGLGAEVPDADVTVAYVAYLEAQPSISAPLSLVDIKRHLRIEADDNEFDSYLELLIPAALNACLSSRGRLLPSLSTEEVEMLSQAMKLLIGTWFANREHAAVDTRGVPTEIPGTLTWLLELIPGEPVLS